MQACSCRRAVTARGRPKGSVEYQMMSFISAADGRKGPASKTTVDIGARGKPKSDPVFDGWLNHHLSRLYGPVLEEPIPKDLLRRLEEKLN